MAKNNSWGIWGVIVTIIAVISVGLDISELFEEEEPNPALKEYFDKLEREREEMLREMPAIQYCNLYKVTKYSGKVIHITPEDGYDRVTVQLDSTVTQTLTKKFDFMLEDQLRFVFPSNQIHRDDSVVKKRFTTYVEVFNADTSLLIRLEDLTREDICYQ